MLARLLFIWMFLLSAQVLASAEGMYIHTDGLGSPVARTDKNGNLISRTRYEPYGATAAGATPTIGFTGHVNDPDTGLIYMQQRYYDPYAGRFLSTDPVLTDAATGSSFNRYVYANNSPYTHIDPDGRHPILIAIIVRAVAQAAARAVVRHIAKEVAKREAQHGSKEGAAAPAKAGSEGAKTGPKTDPSAPHNAKIREVGDKIEADGGKVIAGGGRAPEKVVDTAGGMKDTRRPDVIFKDAEGTERGVNVGKTKADGEPIKREFEALKDLNGPGKLPTTFEKY
jgi:RHS repeat-associated protein